MVFFFFGFSLFYDIIYASVGTDDPKDAVVLCYFLLVLREFHRLNTRGYFDAVDAIEKYKKKKNKKPASQSPAIRSYFKMVTVVRPHENNSIISIEYN